MPTQRTLSTLEFVYHNIEDGLETLDDARGFIGLLDDLDEDERLFLEMALLDEVALQVFAARFLAGGDQASTKH